MDEETKDQVRVEVDMDTTVRTVRLKIEIPEGDTSRDLEDLLAKEWRRKPRPFVPETITATVRDGVLDQVLVAGPLRLKGGGVSSTQYRQGDSMTWYSNSWCKEARYGSAPEWVRRLVDEALQGVTSWTFPKAQEL